MSIADDPLPISLVAHTVFCPRRAWLEAAGEQVGSVAIEQGTADHARVDAQSDERAHLRKSVNLRHDELGLVGRCDVLKTEQDTIDLIEFKSAPLRRRPEVTQAQRIQLALQRLCLEDAGHRINSQSVYFTTHRQSVDVPLDSAALAEARAWVATTRELVESATPPPPLEDDPRCAGCSHVSICLPDEVQGRPARRISVRDPNGEVLHVTHPGARVSVKAGRVVITDRGESLGSVPLERVDGLVLHGNADASSAVIRELLFRGRQVLWTSWTGKLVGYARPAHAPNGQARVTQHVDSAGGRLDLAREFVAAKVANQATFLRRNSRVDVAHTIKRLRELARHAGDAHSIPELFGVEGDAAALYFRAFPNMISDTVRGWATAGWPGRQGRGAFDPLNVALNYVYGILLGDVLRAIVTTGLDPHAGFLHSSGRNKPALALDLMEQFRPVVADSTVIGAINNGEFTEGMVSLILGDARLREGGRRALLAAYRRRVSTEFIHPVFGYTVTWRRAMEVQARMLLGALDGTCAGYKGVRVR
jgi:CRISPR-associated protein Cas1